MNRGMSDQLAQMTKEKPNARQRLLEAAFTEIHMHGFQGMRVDAILEKTTLTKGAFYHHFASKQALGIAVVDELIHGKITEIWLTTLDNSSDPGQRDPGRFRKIGRMLWHGNADAGVSAQQSCPGNVANQ